MTPKYASDVVFSYVGFDIFESLTRVLSSSSASSATSIMKGVGVTLAPGGIVENAAAIVKLESRER